MNPADVEAAHTNLHIDVTTPTVEEIKMFFRQIRNGKAAAPDKIPGETPKSDIEVTANMLHLRFKTIWEKSKCQSSIKKDTSSR